MYFDPYGVLGVTPAASDDEIKKAYRALIRRYHPDANVNNPDKEAAEEQFKRVQMAYDEIQKMRQPGNGGFSGYGQPYGASGQQAQYGYREPYRDFTERFYERYNRAYEEQQRADAWQDGGAVPLEFRAAVNYINAGHYQEALNLLNRMEGGYRNAMWYYLRSHANQGLGNRMNAVQDAQTAAALEPNNMTYRSFYQQLQSGSVFYRSRGSEYGRDELVGSDLCLNLCLLSLCCPCNGPC
ncbi:MAG: DnaJ domain-containing protein [Lachnospiraceae bacterium]|nr:DnaJ domain-containing protein [Lachnospiraceae bacterium]MBP5255163.1 DnaJ domain-containing protein [Lachnospiraceae bacterium]